MVKRRLTPDEWAQARRRWEGSPEEGFAWVAAEIRAAWGVDISRPAVAQMAKNKGWKKGGEPSQPLAPAPVSKEKVAEKLTGDDGKKLTPAPAAKGPPKLSVVGGRDTPNGPADPPAPMPPPPVDASADDDERVTRPIGDKPSEADLAEWAEGVTASDAALPMRALVDEWRESAKVGRPPAYRPEFCDVVKSLCLLRAVTDEDLAGFLRISMASFYSWQQQHQEFLEAVTEGRYYADAVVVSGLYKRAVGYTAVKEKIVMVGMGGGISTPTVVRHREYVAPDVGAATQWLFNRQPKDWRANVQFTAPPPNSIPDTRSLDEIYERKQLAAREVQARVAGRMERMGVTLALADSSGDEELLEAARVIDDESGAAPADEGSDG